VKDVQLVVNFACKLQLNMAILCIWNLRTEDI